MPHLFIDSPERLAAQATDNCQNQEFSSDLPTIHQGKPRSTATVSTRLIGDIFKVHFRIATPRKEIVGKAKLSPTDNPYDFDVAQFFLSPGGRGKVYPYFEFQVTAHDQIFLVTKTAKRHNEHREKLPNESGTGVIENFRFGHRAKISNDHWTVDMEIPLNNLPGWTGKASDVNGSAGVILGAKSPSSDRTFLNLYTTKKNPTRVPNFHQPAEFAEIIKCETGQAAPKTGLGSK